MKFMKIESDLQNKGANPDRLCEMNVKSKILFMKFITDPYLLEGGFLAYCRISDVGLGKRGYK